MTTVVFGLSAVAAGLWWLAWGYSVYGSITIYVAAFIATLATACVFAVRSGEPRNMAAASVLFAKFALHHLAWTTGNPLVWLAIFDLLGAAYFILLGRSPWEFAIGGIFLASVFVSALAAGGFIPGPMHRPDTYIAYSHPDIVALLGHAANCVLGAASGDGGKRIRSYLDMVLRNRSLADDLGHRLFARGGSVDTVEKDKGD